MALGRGVRRRPRESHFERYARVGYECYEEEQEYERPSKRCRRSSLLTETVVWNHSLQLPTPPHTPYERYDTKQTPSICSPPNYDNAQLTSISIERTPSGNSILLAQDATFPLYTFLFSPTLLLSDNAAATLVEQHFLHRTTHDIQAAHSHRLRRLLRSHSPINDTDLAGILTAANALFFFNTLNDRVTWEWLTHAPYKTEIVASTALRRSKARGIETLIVLSAPIIKDPRYARRLAVSAFLHELVHAFLFVKCGLEAREDAHGRGFERIAKVIDGWAGVGELFLCNIEANLDHFREHHHDVCETDHLDLSSDDEHWFNLGTRPVEEYEALGWVRRDEWY